jgi:hypothetical protein
MMTVNIIAIAGVMCLQALSTCILSIVGQYNYAFYLKTYSNHTKNVTHKSTLSSVYVTGVTANVNERCQVNAINRADNEAEIWAQQHSANLFFWINLWNSIPMIIMTCILGLYVPLLGRRFVLMIPMLGKAIQLSIWQAIIYEHLSEYWWYIAAFIVGISGSDSVLSKVLPLVFNYNITFCFSLL